MDRVARRRSYLALVAVQRIMITIELSEKELSKHNPCQEGMELFRSISELQNKKDKIKIKNWTLLHSVWLMSLYPDFEKWLVDRKLIPRADLCNADLRYADLSYANLSKADLSKANLRNANLSYAYLRNADLRYTNLSNANLSYAYLRKADLSYANLYNANLRDAYLSYADLSYADLSYTNLRYANLTGAYRPIDPPEGWNIDEKNGRLVKA